VTSAELDDCSSPCAEVGPRPRRSGIPAAFGSRPSDEVHAERDLQCVAEVMKRMG
jgi:hypothetical protein